MELSLCHLPYLPHLLPLRPLPLLHPLLHAAPPDLRVFQDEDVPRSPYIHEDYRPLLAKKDKVKGGGGEARGAAGAWGGAELNWQKRVKCWWSSVVIVIAGRHTVSPPLCLLNSAESATQHTAPPSCDHRHGHVLPW